jgi:hypothetical protein
MVAISAGKSQYSFSNFLFVLVLQMSSNIVHSATDRAFRYTRREQQDIVAFGKRLEEVDVGLPSLQSAMLAGWLQHFDVIDDYSQPARIDELLAGTSPALALLDSRPGMDRWMVELTRR